MSSRPALIRLYVDNQLKDAFVISYPPEECTNPEEFRQVLEKKLRAYFNKPNEKFMFAKAELAPMGVISRLFDMIGINTENMPVLCVYLHSA